MRCSTTISEPWIAGTPLSDKDFHELTRRAVFECDFWRTHVEDRPLLCSFPLLLGAHVWHHLCRLARQLHDELLAAERELLERRELHAVLGLPPAIRRWLRSAHRQGPTPGLRVMRIDFHWTRDGWRISEANTDVCGGFIESSGLPQLFAPHFQGFRPAGDPAGVFVQGLASTRLDSRPIGLLHLTQFTDDHQIMRYLRRRCRQLGVNCVFTVPERTWWGNGRACCDFDGYRGPLSGMVRFVPADWLGRWARSQAEPFFVGGVTPVCNPAWSILSQSKRFPLAWDELRTPLLTWRELLPPTLCPSMYRGSWTPDWIVKPAFGFEGKDVVVAGAVSDETRSRVWRLATRDPRAWVMQRRFDLIAVETSDGPLYPAVGVYVIGGRIGGAYARACSRPLIDHRAREMIVLVRQEPKEENRDDSG
jgi:glutathionylspermidine synthase